MTSQRTVFCCRLWTIILAVLILLVGSGILGFCLYLRYDYWSNVVIEALGDEINTYRACVYVFIAVGALTLIFSFVGIFGGAKPDRLALVLYLVFLPLALIALVTGGVLVYIYREEIEGSIQNSKLIQEMIKTEYGVNDRITESIKYMQRELHCCGGFGYEDYLWSAWAQDSSSTVPDERKNMLPLECCSDWQKYIDTAYQYCMMYDATNSAAAGDPLKPVNPNVYRTGCNTAVVEFLQDNIAIPAAIALSIAGLLIVTIAVVSVTICFTRKAPAPRQDDVVYEMARTQEKSPYPARGGPYANLYQS